MKRLLTIIVLVLMLVSCGLGGNDMTSSRAQKALEEFTMTDSDFLKYDKGRSMGEVTGVVKTGESKVEIMFTVVNPLGSKLAQSNGKATASATTDGKWILDCIQYEDEYGSIYTGRQECNVNHVLE